MNKKQLEADRDKKIEDLKKEYQDKINSIEFNKDIRDGDWCCSPIGGLGRFNSWNRQELRFKKMGILFKTTEHRAHVVKWMTIDHDLILKIAEVNNRTEWVADLNDSSQKKGVIIFKKGNISHDYWLDTSYIPIDYLFHCHAFNFQEIINHIGEEDLIFWFKGRRTI